MEIHIALQEYFKGINLSQVAIAESLGVSKAYVNSLLSGRQRFGKRQAEIWSDKFGLSKSWLLTGEGDMLKSDSKTDGIAALDVVELESTSAEDYLVPLIPTAALANSLAEYIGPGIRRRDCQNIISPTRGADFAITISGDSMEPKFHDGMIVFLKKINEAAFIPWGNTIVLDTENGAFIKDIYPVEGNDDIIEARSLNPLYPPLVIPKLSIYGMYRVLNATKFFTTM